MTKSEYMQRLQERLDHFSRELREDILEDYEQHFAEGGLQGKTEEEIIEELGNIEDMIRELSESELQGGMGYGLPGTEGLGQDFAKAAEKRARTEASEGGASRTEANEGRRSRTEASEEGGSRKEANEGRGSRTEASEGRESRTEAGEERESRTEASEGRESRTEAGERRESRMETSEGRIKTESGEGGFRTESYEGNSQSEARNNTSKGSAGSGKRAAGDSEAGADNLFCYSGKFDKIVLKGGEADICVKPSDDDKIYVEYVNRFRNGQEIYEYHQHDENGTFYADIRKREDRQGCWTGVEGEGKSWRVMLFGKTVISYRNVGDAGDGQMLALRVRIPVGVPELQVNVESGNIQVDRLVQERVQLESSSGDIKVQKAAADTMKVHTASGDVTVNETKYRTWLDVSASSGDVSIQDVMLEAGKSVTSPVNEPDAAGGSAGKLKVYSASGDIKAQNVTAGKIWARSSSGDVSMVKITAEEVRIVSGSGDADIKDIGCSCSLLVESASGDVSIGDVKAENLDAKASQGDLTISSAEFSAGNVETSRGDMALANMKFVSGGFSTNQGDILVAGLQFDTGKFSTIQGDIAVANTKFSAGSFGTDRGDIAGNNLHGEFGGFTTKSGDIALQDKDVDCCRGYQCVTRSGDISIESNAEVYECSAGSGDIVVRASGSPRKLKAVSSAGDVSVGAVHTPESVEAQSEMGDVHVKLEKTEGMEVDIRTNWGDACVKWDGRRKYVKKGSYTFGNGACRVRAVSEKGDVVVSGESD